VGLLFVTVGTIALPDVWLDRGPGAQPPEGLFDSLPSFVDEEVCNLDGCFRARPGSSLVTRRTRDVVEVDWVVNPDNPLTMLPLEEDGEEEDIRIDRLEERDDILYLKLNSGRIVVRTRDGIWHPGVSEFRAVRGVAATITAMAAITVLGAGTLRARRLDTVLVVVAGAAAGVSHLPVTLWRHTTRYSLSTAVALSVLSITIFAVVGYLAAGPRHNPTSSSDHFET
jgi:hypothetical protein